MQARRQPASHRLLARRNGETRGCKIRAISQWEKPSMRLRSYFLRRAALGGQAFSASFRAERNEQQADRKGDRGHGDRSSQRAVAFDAGAHEKCYPGACVERYGSLGAPVAMTSIAFAVGLLLVPFGAETRGEC